MCRPGAPPEPSEPRPALFMARASLFCATPVACHRVLLKDCTAADEHGNDVKQRSAKGQLPHTPRSNHGP